MYVRMYVCTYVLTYIHTIHIYTGIYVMTRSMKTRHNDAFWNPDFCISEFHIPKALFCSNINAVLRIVFEL